MLNSGASVNMVCMKGKTPLHVAARYKLHNIVLLLIQHNANVNAEICRGASSDAGMTPLHMACILPRGAARLYPNLGPIVKDLLKAGARVDPRDVEGSTPLITLSQHKSDASYDAYVEAAQIALINAGADVNAMNREGKTPVMCAAEAGNTRFIEYLMSCGARINQRCEPEASVLSPHAEMRSGATAIHFTNNDGMSTILKKLVDLGADPNVVSDIGMDFLHPS
jgi:ankyrin repeat protein